MTSKRILIVDDSSSLRNVVAIALEREGYETLQAANGAEGLERVAEAGKLNLIISDVNMPVMNGIEFLRALRQQPRGRFTPVLMLTTEGDDEMKQQGREAGARAWMVKPFDPAQLIDVVSRLVA